MRNYLFVMAIIAGVVSINSTLSAQQLVGIATDWSDSFREWTIYTSNEGEEGYLRASYIDDFTRWEYRIGDWTGQIRTKWPNRVDEWEARGENLIVTGRAIYSNEPRVWRIITPEGSFYKWESRYGNVFDEWRNQACTYGNFELYTTYNGDPRDWTIIDEIDAPLPEKMMLVFLTIINSTPKQ